MTDLIRPGNYVTEAHASWSRWAARCGRCPWGTALNRSTPHIECPFCGAVTEIIWPAVSMMDAVERLLMMRPDPSTRNWFPGETLHELMFENGAHGIFDHIENQGALPGQTLFSVDDGGIRVDRLPVLKHRVRQEITS